MWGSEEIGGVTATCHSHLSHTFAVSRGSIVFLSQNTRDDQFMRKEGSFGLTGSKMLVRDHLAPLPLACGMVAHRSGSKLPTS